MNTYVAAGMVYIVHRDFPLPYHTYSRIASSYSRAAAHIGKCEVVEAALFKHQEKWEVNGDVRGIVATVLNPVEMKKVQALVDSKSLESLVERDRQLALLFPWKRRLRCSFTRVMDELILCEE